MKVYVYSQHARSAGERCWDEDLFDSDDVTSYEGSEDSIAQQARDMLARVEDGQYGAGSDLFYMHTARSLAESVGVAGGEFARQLAHC